MTMNDDRKGTEQARRAFMHALKVGAPGISPVMRQALWETFNRRFTYEILNDYRKQREAQT